MLPLYIQIFKRQNVYKSCILVSLFYWTRG